MNTPPSTPLSLSGRTRCASGGSRVKAAWRENFYNSAISKHAVRARIVVEMGSHPTKRFLFNHTTSFLTKGLEKLLCDFTGTIFVQCENPVFTNVDSCDRRKSRKTQDKTH